MDVQTKHRAILEGVGTLIERFRWPYFTKLSGATLQKLIDDGTVALPPKQSGDDVFASPLFGKKPCCLDKREAAWLDFLLKYPKFVAQGYVGNCGLGTISIDTIVSYEPLTRAEARAFKEHFAHADEFWIGSKASEHRDPGFCGLFARAWFD